MVVAALRMAFSRVLGIEKERRRTWRSLRGFYAPGRRHGEICAVLLTCARTLLRFVMGDLLVVTMYPKTNESMSEVWLLVCLRFGIASALVVVVAVNSKTCVRSLE